MSNELKKRFLISILIIPISLFFVFSGSYFFIIFLVSLFIISTFEWLRICSFNNVKILGIFFLFFSFISCFLLRNENLIFFLLIILNCVLTDIGGYTFGKFFKGPKLIKISPNKTYSGAIGSFLLSVPISYFFLIKFEIDLFLNEITNNELSLVLFLLMISAISQIGDLVISYFKRSSNVKNTGNIFPGHGGLLDRLDGMIFVFPVIYMILNF
jgi:phosphatidate cytidylyltransferase